LRAIAALELAVRENWVEMILTMERALATARELSDDDVWKYRAHVAAMHACPSTALKSINTSASV